jgi:hypothetical protein
MATLSVPQLEAVYDQLAEAIDLVGLEHTELFLTKLCVLMANTLSDPALVDRLVQSALRDL